MKNSARPPLTRQPTVTLGECDLTEPDATTVPVQTKVANWIEHNQGSFQAKDFGDELENGYMNWMMETTDDSEFEKKTKPNVSTEARVRRVSTIKRGGQRLGPARLPRTSPDESFSSSSTSSASEAWLSQSQASNMNKIATPHSLLNSSSSQYFFPETPTATTTAITSVYTKMEHVTSSYGKFEVSGKK